MCVWTSFSLFLVTNSHLELPNRVKISKYQVLEPQVPQQGPGGPRNPQKGFLVSLLTHIGSRFGIDLCA